MTGNVRRAVLQLILLFGLGFSVRAVVGLAQAVPSPANGPGNSSLVTFNKDIAPIVFENCSVCHHPGGSGPFSLITYQDVKKRARQISIVTMSRYMPPWLPEPGYGEFAGQRRLTDDQITIIKRWAEQGAAEGAPSDLPPPPEFSEGWQLGKPDLVMKVPQPFTLPAEGTDIFRNFVIPVPVSTRRYVKAMEIIPGNKRIVHHANVLVDRTGLLRLLDEQDPEPGFGGMEVAIESESFEPESHFLFWKPGTPPFIEPEDMAWRVEKGTDLILNMHLQPSGKPEVIQPLLGIYFSDNPPVRFPMLLQLEHDGAIDIPPGKKGFEVTDEFELPMDVEVLGVYPHAHYLGKEIQGFATLPDGTRKWLIRIKDWDPNWQAVYRYENPFFLPRGSIIVMRWTYDNSTENVRNPNHPPRRVLAGNKSTDEMGHLWIQVLPRNREDLIVLQESLMRQRLRKYPNEFTAHFNLGSVLQTSGRLEEAINHFSRALQARPDDPTARNSMGAALLEIGRLEEAIGHFRHVLRVRPDDMNAHYNLGNALLAQGKTHESIGHFRRVLQNRNDDADAHNGLGSALAIQGDLVQAALHFEQATLIKPDHSNAHYNLGKVLAIQAKPAQAAARYEYVIKIDPENADAHNELGKMFMIMGNFAKAAAHFEQAVRINPAHTEALENLKRARENLRQN